MTHAFTARSTTSRRQFLVASGAAVAAAALLGSDVMPFPSGLDLLADASGPRIPVGFIPGSAGATSLAAAMAAGGVRAVSALGARVEVDAAGPTTMSVHGFAGDPPAVRDRYSQVLADALIPSPAVRDQTIPYYAWTYRGGPAASQSARTRMVVTGADGPRLGLSIATASELSQAQAATAVFGTRRRGDLATFQPGVYLLGLVEGMWSGATSLPSLDDPAWADLPSLVMVLEPVAD